MASLNPVNFAANVDASGLTFQPPDLYIEVATKSESGQDGTLSNDNLVDFIGFYRSDTDPSYYRGESGAGRSWMNSPGTYYWQILDTSNCQGPFQPGAYSDCGAYASPVYTLVVTPRGTSGGGGGVTFSKPQAMRAVKKVVKIETGRAPRDLRTDCRRRSPLRFKCESSWWVGKYLYHGFMTLILDGDTVVYKFVGDKTSNKCLSSNTPLRKCSKQVRWG